jgi:hypothetical protein
LKWSQASASPPPKFRVFRVPAGDVTEIQVNANAEGTDTTLTDGPTGDPAKDLTEGTTYVYQVTALFPNEESDRSKASSATTLPAAPTLSADRIDGTTVKLTWVTNSLTASRFALEFRTPVGEGEFKPVLTDPPGGVVSGLEFDHTLPAGTGAVEYQAFAIVLHGFQNSVRQDIRSKASNVANVATAPAADLENVFTVTLTKEQALAGGYCIIERFPANKFPKDGSQIRVTLRGATLGDLKIDNVYISQVEPGGAQPYDPAPDLMQLASNVVVPANSPAVLGPMTYALDHTKELLIAFDINAASNPGNVRFAEGVTGMTSHVKPATAEAGKRPRSAGYSTGTGNVVLIESIDIA